MQLNFNQITDVVQMQAEGKDIQGKRLIFSSYHSNVTKHCISGRVPGDFSMFTLSHLRLSTDVSAQLKPSNGGQAGVQL